MAKKKDEAAVARGKKRWAKISAKKRSAFMSKVRKEAWAEVPAEERSAAAAKAGNARMDRLTDEQRTELGRAGAAAFPKGSPQAIARNKKAVETRLRNKLTKKRKPKSA